MKRIAMTMLGLVALASTTLKAQDKSWNFRVGAGVNVSQISNYLTGDPHFGLRVSGQVLKNFSNTGFGVLSGLEFTNKGEQFKSGNGGVSLNSLQIPLFASYHFNLNTDNRVYVEAGPYFNYVLSGKYGDKDIFSPSRNDSSFESQGYGIGVNLGYNYRNLLVRFGYEHSLSSVLKSKEKKALSNNSISEVSFGVAWQF